MSAITMLAFDAMSPYCDKRLIDDLKELRPKLTMFVGVCEKALCRQDAMDLSNKQSAINNMLSYNILYRKSVQDDINE